jgi:glutaryl-CoA dehydrogenase
MPDGWEDYFGLASELPEEAKEMGDVLRRWLDTHVRPGVSEWWQNGQFPTAIIPDLARMGVFGPTLPERYGGADASPITYGVMMQELERCDSGLRSFVSVQSGLAMTAIYLFGSEEQRRRYLPAMAQGRVLGCFGLTEPDAGSDPQAMRTRAKPVDGGWEITGAKRWITNGNLADVAVIWAKDDAGAVRGFLVPTTAPGFRAQEILHKGSLRMSVTSDLYLDQVRVSASALLPHAQGLKSALRCLTQARYGIVWGTVGAAMDCLDEALEYARRRTVFGRPLAQTQLAQERLVAMLSRLVDMQLRATQLGRLYQRDQLKYTQVSLAKRNNARQALETARLARELLGGNGISLAYRAMRHLANLETVDTYEGTYEIHTLTVGRDLTGLSAF